MTFSTILSTLIQTKNIKTYALAQYCGIDRSNMYKIINGKRKPTSVEMVNKMSNFMKLSLSEKADLMEAYFIELAGHDNYYRRKHVAQLFQNFHIPRLDFHIDTINTTDFFGYEKTDSTILYSQAELNRAILYILSSEFHSNNGKIQLLIQPDYDFLLDILIANHCNPNVTIDHIFCLNSKHDLINQQLDYNLHCLEKILPLYGNAYHYNCYYYYNDINYKDETMSVFPYAIITSRFACLISDDLHKGVLIAHNSFLQLLHTIFNEHLANTSPLLRPMKKITEQINYMHTIGKSLTNGYFLQMTPCLTPFFTRTILEKYLIQELPNRQQLIDALDDYISDFYNNILFPSYRSIFSLNGIRKFLETGRTGEYPTYIYNEIELKDRVYLVKQLLKSYRSHPYSILKQDICSLENELFLTINQQTGYLMFIIPENEQIVFLDIEEPGLLSAFLDYCDNLDEHLFFSQEEAEHELKALISEFS